jgi:hypothetical protein
VAGLVPLEPRTPSTILHTTFSLSLLLAGLCEFHRNHRRSIATKTMATEATPAPVATEKAWTPKSKEGEGGGGHLRDDDDVIGEGRPPVVRRARARLPPTKHTQRLRQPVTDLGDRSKREGGDGGILTDTTDGAGPAAGSRCRSRTRCLSMAFSIAPS